MYTREPLSPPRPAAPALTRKRPRLVLLIGLAALGLAILLVRALLIRTSDTPEPPRKFNSAAIRVPEGYTVQVAITNLTAPTTAIFDGNDLLIAESDFPPRILRIKEDGAFETLVCRGLQGLVAGLALRDGQLYISHKGKVSVVAADGRLRDLVADLPSEGEHQNNHIAFGPDGNLYVVDTGVGTMTAQGPVFEPGTGAIWRISPANSRAWRAGQTLAVPPSSSLLPGSRPAQAGDALTSVLANLPPFLVLIPGVLFVAILLITLILQLVRAR
jgi:hypothetical protein